MIDGLKKLGPHGFSRVLLVDGQLQQEITGVGLWHAQVTDAGQDADRHPDTLHASAGNSVQACHEHWRKGNRTNEESDQPDGMQVANVQSLALCSVQK